MPVRKNNKKIKELIKDYKKVVSIKGITRRTKKTVRFGSFKEKVKNFIKNNKSGLKIAGTVAAGLAVVGTGAVLVHRRRRAALEEEIKLEQTHLETKRVLSIAAKTAEELAIRAEQIEKETAEMILKLGASQEEVNRLQQQLQNNPTPVVSEALQKAQRKEEELSKKIIELENKLEHANIKMQQADAEVKVKEASISPPPQQEIPNKSADRAAERIQAMVKGRQARQEYKKLKAAAEKAATEKAATEKAAAEKAAAEKSKSKPKKGSRDDIQEHNLGLDKLGLYRNRSLKEEFLRKSQNKLDESDKELLYEVARDRSLTPQQQKEEIKRIKRNLIKEAPNFGKRKQRKQKSKSRRR
jgi:hypothetical protein